MFLTAIQRLPIPYNIRHMYARFSIAENQRSYWYAEGAQKIFSIPKEPSSQSWQAFGTFNIRNYKGGL